jgi:hypothetical protein
MYVASLPAGRASWPDRFPAPPNAPSDQSHAVNLPLPIIDPFAITRSDALQFVGPITLKLGNDIPHWIHLARAETTVYVEGIVNGHWKEIRKFLMAWSAKCPEVLISTRTDTTVNKGVHANNFVGGKDIEPYYNGHGRYSDDAEINRRHAEERADIYRSHFRVDGDRSRFFIEDTQPRLFTELNLAGPGLLARLIAGAPSQAEDLLKTRAHGISALDACLMTPTQVFGRGDYEQVVSGPRFCSRGGDMELMSRLCAPKLELDRLRELAALCAEDDELARHLSGKLGDTANGCHVVAFMARAAKHESIESRGVANVLRQRTEGFRFGVAQDVLTVQQLVGSGNVPAWDYLLKTAPAFVEPRHFAFAALDVPEDLETLFKRFGVAPLHRLEMEPFPDIPDSTGGSNRYKLFKKALEYYERLAAEIRDARNLSDSAMEIIRGASPSNAPARRQRTII